MLNKLTPALLPEEQAILDYLLDQVPDNACHESYAVRTDGFPVYLCELVRNLRIVRMRQVADRLNAVEPISQVPVFLAA